MELKNKAILVVGLGRSGVAASVFLRHRGARVTVTDTAPADRLKAAVAALREMEVRMHLGGHRRDDFVAADLVVLSPGVPHTLPEVAAARDRGIPVVGEMALAARYIREPIVAVSGTNGKTTTTELLASMLRTGGKKVFVGGNIGTPLIAYAHGDHGDADLLVVEVSSFQLDTAADFRPDTAVMLNITDDHLDRYPDSNAYARAKWRLFAHQGAADTAILNTLDATVAAMLETDPPRAGDRQTISTGDLFNGAQLSGDRMRVLAQGRPVADFTLARSGLVGPHNHENIAAACLAARRHDVTDAAIQTAIDAFRGLPHRLETVGWAGGVRFVNDSKATNVNAVQRALECFDRPVVLILGGQNKQGDFSQLRPQVRRQVKAVVAMGAARNEIVAALADCPPNGICEADSMAEALRQAVAIARPGETVLLSPACASFDRFTSYAHRGDRFRALVEKLT